MRATIHISKAASDLRRVSKPSHRVVVTETDREVSCCTCNRPILPKHITVVYCKAGVPYYTDTVECLRTALLREEN